MDDLKEFRRRDAKRFAKAMIVSASGRQGVALKEFNPRRFVKEMCAAEGHRTLAICCWLVAGPADLLLKGDAEDETMQAVTNAQKQTAWWSERRAKGTTAGRASPSPSKRSSAA